MKQPKNVDDFASRLVGAAAQPLQTLAPVEPVEPVKASPRPSASPKAVAPKSKAKTETLGINLRPPRVLYERYVELAADRSKQTGRTVSAQQIMLEVLERGRA